MTAGFDVAISEAAEADLRAIHHYLVANGAVEAADRLIEALLSRAAALEAFPRRGSVPDELVRINIGEFRQIVEPPYRLIYEVSGRRVIVHLVAHGRQDLRELLRRRLLISDPEKS